jgi:putative endonuclease
MDDRKQLGKLGEEKAVRYLISKGFKILDRNYKCKTGEIDIIAMEGKTLVFIEVKTRRGLSYGLPCESVTSAKKRHLLRTLRYYVAFHGLEEMDMRVDVIEILALKKGIYLNHIKNIV